MTNREEYLADTDPNDPSSYLRIDTIETDFVTTGSVRLTFPAKPFRTYSILYKDTLAAPTWQKLTDVGASPPTASPRSSTPRP